MSLKFKKVSVQNIEGGKTAALINEYLDVTAKDLFRMLKDHDIDPKKLKGKVTVNIIIQPLSDAEDHYHISSEVSRTLPKIINSSIAVREEDGGLFVQERGSDLHSPLQTTIEDIIHDVEKEGDFITDEDGNRIDTSTGEIKKA